MEKVRYFPAGSFELETLSLDFVAINHHPEFRTTRNQIAGRNSEAAACKARLTAHLVGWLKNIFVHLRVGIGEEK